MLKIRKALPKDVEPIVSILAPYVENGIILKRKPEEIVENIDQFFIAENNNEVLAVASFHDYGKKLKEIRSLAVNNNYQKKGIGKKLVENIVKIILESEPDTRIFTLTYSTDFFKKIGFKEVKKDSFPEKIWKDCLKCPKIDCCDEIALEYIKR